MTTRQTNRIHWIDGDGRLLGDDADGRNFTVERHGQGRKYWGVTYPDGTYTHNARTQREAKAQAEAWEPDPTLVKLVDDQSVAPDGAAGDESGQADDRPADRQDFLPVAGDDWQTASAKHENLRRHRRSALESIPALVAARASLDAQIADMVERARLTSGSYYDYDRPTWEQIGKALGVTKQSAQAKYGKKPSSSS